MLAPWKKSYEQSRVSEVAQVVSDSLRPHGLTVAYQAPLSMGFSRQEYWSGFPFPSPGNLPDPGLLHCRQILYHLSYRYFTI